MGVALQALERAHEVPLQGFEALEDAVVEELLAQLVSQVLDRVEFGRIGRQLEQEDVGRRFERLGAVPAGAVL